jgi:protein CsiD
MSATFPLHPADTAASRRHVQRQRGFEVMPHRCHPRLLHISLAPEVIQAFRAETAEVDLQNLQYVPFMRFHLARTLARLAGDGFMPTLRSILTDRDSGGFTLGGGDSEYVADSVRLGTAVAHLIGPPNFDAMSGTYYARFSVKDTDASDSYLRQAYRLFTLHTDGTFVEDATDWLLMMKIEERNAVGGESRLLHLDDWEELNRFATHPLATHAFTYTSPPSKNVSQSVSRPTFFWRDGRPCICFIDQFVQPECLDEAQYLKELSDSMERSPGTAAIPLPVGEMVVLNNLFWLHGRAPFEKHPHLHRELMRIRGRFSRS